jgi:hypothetical protein
MSTDKPIVPNEWTDLYIALGKFAEACGGSFHCSDPVKAEAMARVFGTAAYLLDYREDEAIRLQISGRDFADDLVARARKPLGRYTVMDESDALAMLHRVASDRKSGAILIIGGSPFVDRVILSSSVGAVPTWRPNAGRLNWPNGSAADVFTASCADHVRGISARFALVVDWPSQEDWPHVEMAVREGAAQIVMLSEPPYPIGGAS